MLGISRGRVSQLLTSREEPSARLIAKLLIVTQLPFERLFRVIKDKAQLSLSNYSIYSQVREDDVPAKFRQPEAEEAQARS